jgi:preprotein translocase subunit SecE
LDGDEKQELEKSTHAVLERVAFMSTFLGVVIVGSI